MKPIQLHIYLPFSYWQDRDMRTGAPLQKPSEELLQVYLQCLSLELAGMKEDYHDCQVTGIRFFGGYLGLLDGAALEKLLAILHRCFTIKKDCPVSGILFPGCLDMELLSVYRNHHVGPMLFEVPTLLFRECQRWGYPVTMQALDQTVYFLQNFQADDLGLRIPIGIPDRTANMWETILGQLYHYHPAYVQFYSIAPELPENPAFAGICRKLAEHGYRSVSPLTYSLTEQIPFSLQELSRTDEYVGAGLGAISQIDGYRMQNTTDPAYYRDHCREYRNLIRSVERIF